MFRITLFCIVLGVLSCKNSISESELGQLGGYWEIKEVKFPNGEIKTYGPSTTIDFIQVKEQKGYRKKVQPQLNGTFNISKDAELFVLIKKEGHFFFSYENELSAWEEKLVRLETDTFAVVNSDTLTYTYRRYEPIDILQ